MSLPPIARKIVMILAATATVEFPTETVCHRQFFIRNPRTTRCYRGESSEIEYSWSMQLFYKDFNEFLARPVGFHQETNELFYNALL